MDAAPEPPWRTTYLDIIRQSFRPAGRAKLTDLVGFWLSAAFLQMVVGLPLLLLLSSETFQRAMEIVWLVLLVPLPALMVRRLHDQGRSGKWLCLALPGLALWLAQKTIARTTGLDARVRFDTFAWPLDWLQTGTTLALIILMLLPSTRGPNRFGPDPRWPD
ncbi:MAG TPA: DUF805 domain-containing protein [Novosphingobium sp.]|nr:DUF805 domain-containing protein [Novosphingobium sp.]